MELLEQFFTGWHFVWYEIISGAVGGLVNYIWKHRQIELPSRSGKVVDLNFLVAPLLGAFVAFVVDTHPVMCALLGFSANDVLKAAETAIRRRLEKETKDQQS